MLIGLWIEGRLAFCAAGSGHYNSAWGYWVTDAVGIHELLLLCEMVSSPSRRVLQQVGPNRSS
jgi:hypothetical protein